MWLYHVPFTICVVSVLKIAFCDQKKEPYYFFSSILRFLTKRGRQVWFPPGTPASSTTKTSCHDIAESGVKHNISNQEC